VAQQYASSEQMSAAHESQVFVSFLPLVQIEWLHVEPVPQVSPHTEPTSPTQTESHAVVQQ
jgi:hypothetical protein